jgi:hypothetical protein
MKQIKILHLVFSYDLKNKNTYILSTNSDDIIVPYSIIDKPIFIQEQIKTTILGFFQDPTIKNIIDIDVCMLEIQNDLLMRYIEDNNDKYSYDQNEDLCMLSSTIMLDKNFSMLNWLPIEFETDLSKKKSVDFLIDDTLKRISL